MGCRDVSYAIEVGHKIDGQPGAIATKNSHAIDTCCEKTGVCLNGGIVDDRAVCGNAFGGLDAVNAGGDFETVEWDISC